MIIPRIKNATFRSSEIKFPFALTLKACTDAEKAAKALEYFLPQFRTMPSLRQQERKFAKLSLN